MSTYYSEQDPLLPKDKGAPEIQGSRPQSIKNDCVIGDEADEEEPRQNPSRDTNFIAFIFGLCFFIVLSLMIFSKWDEVLKDLLPDKRPNPKTIEERVSKILSDTPLIDGHNDLAILIRLYYNNHIYDDDFTSAFEKGGMRGQVDLPRLKDGKNGGAFWSAYVPCPANWTDFSDRNYAESVAFTYNQIDLLNRLQAAYPTHFSTPGNSSTAFPSFKSGRYISPIGIEGLHQIGNSFSNLRTYYSLGVRYATLTHNCHNIYADAAIVSDPNAKNPYKSIKAPPLWGGVSENGKELIGEMNRIGMIVDLAHVSVNTMRDVLGGSDSWSGSAAPIIFSHSSVYALCPHPRNVPDDILHLVKKTNSVVMINFAPDFISCVANPDPETGIPDFYPGNNTIAQVVRHIKYIGELVGYEHVGLGSDFDGIPSTPEGLDDVSKFPDLVAELLKEGVTDKEAGFIVGGNVLRVWKDVDAVAAKLQKEGVKPIEDKLPSLFPPEV